VAGILQRLLLDNYVNFHHGNQGQSRAEGGMRASKAAANASIEDVETAMAPLEKLFWQ
jgi:hypothetical protein